MAHALYAVVDFAESAPRPTADRGGCLGLREGTQKKRSMAGVTAPDYISISGGIFRGSFVILGDAHRRRESKIHACLFAEWPFAMRINYGPFGETSVEVFRSHGFQNDDVFIGSLDDDKDPRWVNDGELQVFQTDASEKCVSTPFVRVDCVLTKP